MSKNDSHALTTVEPMLEEKPQKAPLSVGLPVFILVVLCLIYGGYWAYGYLQDEQKLPVQEVVISGELKMLNEASIEKLIRQQAQGSFFALDVNEVHALVESQAWVYSASIRKRWPSKLYIHIVEQQAVAVWNDDLLLNRYGESFDGFAEIVNNNSEGELSQQQRFLDNLPKLFGPGGSEKTALTGYTHMQRLLRAGQQNIAELVLSERFAWQAKLENKIILKLGRQEYINRLQRFIDVYPFLATEQKEVSYVDLRYDTGLAVGWGETKPRLTQEENNT